MRGKRLWVDSNKFDELNLDRDGVSVEDDEKVFKLGEAIGGGVGNPTGREEEKGKESNELKLGGSDKKELKEKPDREAEDGVKIVGFGVKSSRSSV